MKYLKAFMAGIVIPTIVLPFFVYGLTAIGKSEIVTIPFMHFIPVLWGIWNILYFGIFKHFLPSNVNLSILINGAVLGFIIACIGIFWFNIPELIGIPDNYRYLPLIAAPIVYAIVWLIFVKPLNDILGLRDL